MRLFEGPPVPFGSRKFLGSQPRDLGADSLRHHFGMIRIVEGFDRSAVRVRAVVMTRVVIIDMNTNWLKTMIGRGTLRNAYPRSICIVVAGTMTYVNAQGAVTAGSGEVLILGDHDSEQHPAVYEFSDGFHGVLILASTDVAGPPESDAAPRPPFVSALGAPFVAFLRSLLDTAESEDDVPSPATTKAAEEFTSRIFNTLAFDQMAAEMAAPHSMRDPFTRAQAIIQAKAHLPRLDPAAIAAEMAISVGHLHKVFAKHGRKVGAEIRDQRTKLALELLHDTRHKAVSIEAIAQSAGFESSRTMRRAVHATTGATPGQIRRRAARRASIPANGSELTAQRAPAPAAPDIDSYVI